MKLPSLLILIVLISTSSFSQNYKFGKVSKEELLEKVHPLEKDANAAILYREYKVYYTYTQGVGFSLNTEVFERIKIYDTKGYDWASKRVRVFNYNADREEISGLKGVTYTLEDGSVKKDKLRSDGIFEEQINNYYKGHSFTMPNLKPGCIIEYEYKISSPYNTIDDINLQYTIPVKKEFVEVKIPEYFIFRNYNNPQSDLNFKYDQDSKNVEVEIRGRSGLGTVGYRSNSDRQGGLGSSMATYKEMKYTLNTENIPALKKEKYVDNINNYRSKSIWELVMYNDPVDVPKRYSTDWDAVTKTIYEDDSFVNQLNKTSYFEEDVAAAISGIEAPLDKMNALLHLVKSKVQWNRGRGYFPEEGVKQAFNKGSGNSGDINLILISMLRSINLNANPVLLSTKDHGIPVFPTRFGFNYVVAAVEYNGKLYLMDATEPLSGINLLPERTRNWQGRLIRPDGTSNWIGLYPDYLSQKLTYVQAEIVGDLTQMKVRERLAGNYAMDYRKEFVNTSTEMQIDQVEKNGEEVIISDFEVKDLDNLKPNVTRSYSVESSTLLENINGDLYISPLLYFAQLENPFKAESRNYPIFFEYPKSNKYAITIKIPEGYKITSIPKGAKLQLADNKLSYTYLVQELGGNLQISVAFEINSPILIAEDYEFIKAFFDQMVEKEKEKVVLSKV